MTEDAELLITLYDAKEYKAITENYVVHWSRDGLMSDLDQMYNLRVMFTVKTYLCNFSWLIFFVISEGFGKKGSREGKDLFGVLCYKERSDGYQGKR